ncbi:MAG: hypothetical protein LBR60_05455 [Fibrobacter sp.]|jgi:lysophospholipase L1-like esterase|nr:hypothetical protein [Fibrobacter sp.]
MKPLQILIALVSLFVLLGGISLVFPANGIPLGPVTLHFASLKEMFPEAREEAPKEDPEEAIRRMMEETRAKKLTAFADSIRFYLDFFEKGATRFDLPANDPGWFDRFFASLEKAKEDSSVVHIIHYGDSQLEEDRISATLRENLQTLFGGSGPGMLPAVMRVPSITISHWNNGDLEHFQVFAPQEERAAHTRYGPMAQVTELSGNAQINIKKRVSKNKNDFPLSGTFSQVRLLAGKTSRFSVKLSFEQEILADSANPESSKRKRVFQSVEPTVEKKDFISVYTWKFPSPTGSVRLNLSGKAEIYAISAEGNSGVAVDNVAMRGSSGTVFNRIHSGSLAEAYQVLNAKLIILEYGGNLVPSSNKNNIEWTKNLMARQFEAIRKANPEADILFIGPADMARQVNGRFQTYPALNIVIQALKEAALENDIAYWDMHRVMGGNGSIMKWVKRSPPLGFTDHVHFTRTGAAHMGNLLFNALSVHYDYYEFRKRHALDAQEVEEIKTHADTLSLIPDSSETVPEI